MKNKLLEMMAWRLSRIDRHLISVLASRLGSGGVSDWVAAAKFREKSRPDRDKVEEQRLGMATKWANDVGLNPNFASMMVYAAIEESFRRQSIVAFDRLSVVDVDVDNVDLEKCRDFHRAELLRLTHDVAPHYDKEYACQFGIKSYLDFEREKIAALIESVKDPLVAVDLGCATGEVAFDLAKKFKRVFGYDISPDMVELATKKASHWEGLLENVCFGITDLDLSIPLPDNTVSAAVMNLGTAGDIRNIDNLLEEIKRVLVPGGKFLLSFYNSESLFAKFGFLPWSTSLRAMVDKQMGILDVTFDSKLYLIYAMPRSVDEIKKLLAAHGLDTGAKFFTHPTLSSILPEDIMSTESFAAFDAPLEDRRYLTAKVKREEATDAQKSLTDLDRFLSESPLNLGAYIIVTGEKQ
jgi:SAM-dependent methyltransferase/chorismate mutase